MRSQLISEIELSKGYKNYFAVHRCNASVLPKNVTFLFSAVLFVGCSQCRRVMDNGGCHV